MTMGVTMRKMMTAAIAAMVLAGCGKSGPPPKREPGSWSQTMELKRFEGQDAEKAKAAITQVFATMSAMTLCVTPEMAAKEDVAANLEKLGGNKGNCTFDRKSVAGGALDLSGTCKDPSGKTAKITATGTIGASDQDINMTVEGFDAAGAKQGLMEMRVHSVRKGECTASDMKAPAATAM